MNFFELLSRNDSIFKQDIESREIEITNTINQSSFLVIGGAGTIGQACVKEIFERNPKLLHVIDISENNLVELVRDIRSSMGYIKGDFKTFTMDSSDIQFEMLLDRYSPYDYILNLSAMKHVRNEKDPFSLMRMVEINILNSHKILGLIKKYKTKKYFCVSTDKASSPVNMMGASKRIMEHILESYSKDIEISTARFANVAFSDGSLLCGVQNRLYKKQPISAPYDIKRYFLTSKESGQLCLLSTLLGKNKKIFFPNPSEKLKAFTFPELIEKFLHLQGFKIKRCDTEEEARRSTSLLIPKGVWPCYFFKTDTGGEKIIEQFYSDEETLLENEFYNVGVLNIETKAKDSKLYKFIDNINFLLGKKEWTNDLLINAFEEILPEFKHHNIRKNLEDRM